MARSTRGVNGPGAKSPVPRKWEKVRRLQWKLYQAAKRSDISLLCMRSDERLSVSRMTEKVTYGLKGRGCRKAAPYQ